LNSTVTKNKALLVYLYLFLEKFLHATGAGASCKIVSAMAQLAGEGADKPPIQKMLIQKLFFHLNKFDE